MPGTVPINARIVEGLYCEALILADEVRSAFALAARIEPSAACNDPAMAALSCEAVRTTTRIMHALAWLLNHRAFLKGEMSEFQLRRNGGLSSDLIASQPDKLALIDEERRQLIELTERFYARLLRLERSWLRQEVAAASPVLQMRERIGSTVARRRAAG